MSRYLITGGAGFIGSHVVEKALSQGHQVRVLDNLFTGNANNLAGVKDKVEFVQGDITDKRVVNEVMQGIEYVIHLAAWRSVPKSMSDPVGYTEVNVVGTVNLLEAASKQKAKRFVCISSSSVYGDTDQMPLREDMPTRPISPYAASKLADELYCALFSRAFGLETVALRYFNVFGPRQSLEDDYAVVIPKFIASLLKKQSPPVYGDGKQSRDFTYIENVAEATYLASQTSGISGEALNIALGEENSVIGLLNELNKIMGLSIPPAFKPPRAGDVRRTLSDPSKANRLLRWKGTVGFAEGLRHTVEWFRKNPPA